MNLKTIWMNQMFSSKNESYLNNNNIIVDFSDSNFDSEDDVPLARVVPAHTRRPPIWDKRVTVDAPLPIREDSSLLEFVQLLESPLELFQWFISDDVVEAIVFQTNLMPNKNI